MPDVGKFSTILRDDTAVDSLQLTVSTKHVCMHDAPMYTIEDCSSKTIIVERDKTEVQSDIELVSFTRP